MNSPITKKNGTDLLRLMDYCFKRGVVDACEVGDNYAVQTWYDEMLHSGRYGLVSFPDEEFDWRRWRFIIHKWAREQRFPYSCTDYIDGIRKAQGMGFVIVPMTMRFYLMGVGEWLEYPNDLAILMFKAKKFVRWSNKVPSHMKNMKNEDMILLIQEFSYEFKQYPAGEVGNLGPHALDDFEMAIWTAAHNIKKQ